MGPNEKRVHTKKKCKSLYNLQKENGIICEKHNEPYLQGGFCRFCHPDISVYGIPQWTVEEVPKNFNKIKSYNISGGNVDYQNSEFQPFCLSLCEDIQW